MGLTVIDLFAGAGGLSNGFLQTECFQIKVAVEIDRDARKTYSRNHENTLILEDVKSIDYQQLIHEFGEIDVVIGGPPCQGFSNANRQRNDLISGNNELVKEYIRAIEELQPKAFVLENVKTMNSDKHKFFYCHGDEEDLRKIGIIPMKEEFIIGSRNKFSERLVEFIEKDGKPCVTKKIITDFSKYLLDEKIISKFNSILRAKKIDKFKKIVLNSKDCFMIEEAKWLAYHQEYWNGEYRELYLKTRQHLIDTIENGFAETYSIKNSLNMIIEIQKIFSKLIELKSHNVVIDSFEISEKGIKVELETYNVFKYLLKKTKDIGYKVQPDILKASQFGVPQDRERLFVIGVKESDLKCNLVDLPKPIFTSSEQYFTVGDAIADIEEIEPHIDINTPFIYKEHTPTGKFINRYLNDTNKLYNHVMTKSTNIAKERFLQLLPGQNFHDLDDSLKHTYTEPSRTQSSIYKRLDYSVTSDTVTNVRKSMWIHPRKDRAISIREAARLQSFKDSFVFEGNKDRQYQQVGNAVPPLLARAVAEQILVLLGKRPEKTLREEFLKETAIIDQPLNSVY